MDQRLHSDLTDVRGGVARRLNVAKVDNLVPEWDKFAPRVVGNTLDVYLGTGRAKASVHLITSRHFGGIQDRRSQ